MTLIILVRHGENDWVKKHRLAGWLPGVHLNKKGCKQAEDVARRLAGQPLTAVYSSPVERCMETAEPIARKQDLRIKRLKGVGEMRYGDWEGKKIKKLAKDPLWHVVQHAPSRMEFPGGETMRGAQRRAVNSIEKLSKRHGQEMIAVVSHADVIRLVLAHYLGTHIDLFQRLSISPGSISLLLLGPNGMTRVLRVNDSGPLPIFEPPKHKAKKKG